MLLFVFGVFFREIFWVFKNTYSSPCKHSGIKEMKEKHILFNNALNTCYVQSEKKPTATITWALILL